MPKSNSQDRQPFDNRFRSLLPLSSSCNWADTVDHLLDQLLCIPRTFAALATHTQVFSQFAQRARAPAHAFTDLGIGNRAANADIHARLLFPSSDRSE